MSRDWWTAPEPRTTRQAGATRRSAAATAYDYSVQERELLTPTRRTRRRARTKTRSASSRRFALFLTVVLAWAGIGYASGLVRIMGLRADIARANKELATLQKQNRELAKSVAAMQTPQYVERVAREQLGLVRPDEIKFVVGKTAGQNRRDVALRPNRRSELH